MNTHTHTQANSTFFLITFLLLFGLIISSCTKDDIESEIDNAEKISFVDDLANYTSETNTIIRDDSDSAQIILPNDEELQDLADYLQASLESDI